MISRTHLGCWVFRFRLGAIELIWMMGDDMFTSEFNQRLNSVASIRQQLLQRGFVWGAATATGVYLLIALWVRAGGM